MEKFVGDQVDGGTMNMSDLIQNLPSVKVRSLFEAHNPAEEWFKLEQAIKMCRDLIKGYHMFKRNISIEDVEYLHSLARGYLENIVFAEIEANALKNCIEEKNPHAFVWKFNAFCENMHEYILSEEAKHNANFPNQVGIRGNAFIAYRNAYLLKMKWKFANERERLDALARAA